MAGDNLLIVSELDELGSLQMRGDAVARVLRPALSHIGVVVSVALLLTGCSSTGDADHGSTPNVPESSTPLPDVDVPAAKARTQRTEREIAKVVPERSAVRQQEKGALFPCGERQRQWAGGTNVLTTREPDMDAVVSAVEKEWGDRPGWEVETRQDSHGLATIDISTGDGEGYLVARGTDARTVHIRSSSSCFAVPEVFSGGGTW